MASFVVVDDLGTTSENVDAFSALACVCQWQRSNRTHLSQRDGAARCGLGAVATLNVADRLGPEVPGELALNVALSCAAHAPSLSVVLCAGHCPLCELIARVVRGSHELCVALADAIVRAALAVAAMGRLRCNALEKQASQYLGLELAQAIGSGRPLQQRLLLGRDEPVPSLTSA